MKWRHSCAQIVAAIARGATDAHAIAERCGLPVKSVQNRLGELRNYGIVREVDEIMPSEKNEGRSRIVWGIAA